jgi:hypothetical protein
MAKRLPSPAGAAPQGYLSSHFCALPQSLSTGEHLMERSSELTWSHGQVSAFVLSEQSWQEKILSYSFSAFTYRSLTKGMDTLSCHAQLKLVSCQL